MTRLILICLTYVFATIGLVLGITTGNYVSIGVAVIAMFINTMTLIEVIDDWRRWR